MNVLTGIKNFLEIVNDNWTVIIVIAGLCIALYQKIDKYIKLSNDEKIEIAKTQIREVILKLISDAESDYTEWVSAGSIKRAQVIEEIYTMYPILSKFSNQTDLIHWIDTEIDNALNTLRDIIDKNNAGKTSENIESK